MEEVTKTLFSIGFLKALGDDCILTISYKKNWDVLKRGLFRLCD